MLSQNSNLFDQIRYLVKAGMFGEAIITYSKLRYNAMNEPELLSDKFFQREIKESEYSLTKIVRDRIQEIYHLNEQGNTEKAFAHGMQLAEILDIEPTRRYFTEYLYELRNILEQLNNNRHVEQDFYQIQRLVEHHELSKALYRLETLKDEVHPRARIRGEIERLYDELRGITNVTLVSVNSNAPTVPMQVRLTAQYLEKDVAPFLNAISEIQRLLDELSGRNVKDVSIRVITQNSPIGVSLEGVSETFLAVTDLIIPWKRKHAEKMAEYARRVKQYEIEQKRIELQEANLQITKSQQDIEKTSVEISKMEAEAEKIRIENEKGKIELERAKIQLALDVLEKIAPNLPEQDKLSALMKLLPLLETVIASDIEIAK